MDKPLITFLTYTYNQERYIRDAVRGILSQDYEPLEIIISDDCSSDATWDIICHEVEEYKNTNGFHKNIVLNRNEHNMGIVKHVQYALSLCHGVLKVDGAGDDISLPTRVSRVVEEWEKSGRQATIIHHGYVEMDVDGRDIRPMPPRDAACSLGAAAAYAMRVFREFPPPGEKVTIEDQLWAKRALMLGPELQIPDVLVRYRVGCGVSTKFVDERERMYKNAYTMFRSCEQALIDLENVKSSITNERYDAVYKICKRLCETSKVDYIIVSDLPLSQRIRAVFEKYKQGRLGRGWLDLYFNGMTYIQPFRIGLWQRERYSILKKAFFELPPISATCRLYRRIRHHGEFAK